MAKSAPAPVADTSARVLRVSEHLRQQLVEARTYRRLRTTALIGTIISEELPAIVEALGHLGVESDAGKKRPLRLLLPTSSLDELRVASEETGLPATLLMVTAIRRAALAIPASRKPKTPAVAKAKGTQKKATPKATKGKTAKAKTAKASSRKAKGGAK